MQILVFEVEGERYALETGSVREVVRAVAVSRLPGAPPIVLGVVDVRGAVVPVLDLRARFGLPPRAVDPAEHFVIAEAGARVVALRADNAVGIAEVDDSAVGPPRQDGADAGYVAAAAQLPDGLVLIHDLRTFLGHAEAVSLDAALAEAGA